MNRRSGSSLFLMEQLIVIAVFAVCAAACVKILTSSNFITSQTRDKSYAIRAAESCAESYKAVSGDIEKTASVLGGNAVNIDGNAAAVVYYNKDWQICAENDAIYKLCLMDAGTATDAVSLQQGNLTVEKLSGGVIIAFPVAVNTKQ